MVSLRPVAKCGVKFVKGISLFGIEISVNHNNVDKNSVFDKTMSEKIDSSIKNETGWDRLKAIFVKDEFGGYSPEIENVITAGTTGFICGTFMGAMGASKSEYINFIDKNKTSVFESHFHAKKQLQNQVTKAMVLGGWRIGWRMALFTGSYVFFTTAVSTYRNKSSVLEYSAGGLLAGAMYKIPMGSKAMISGGLVGSFLGTVAGCICLGGMKLTGTTAEELKYWRGDWKEATLREVKSVNNPQRKEALGPLGIYHELGLKNKDSKNDSLDSMKPDQQNSVCVSSTLSSDLQNLIPESLNSQLPISQDVNKKSDSS